MHEDYFLLRRPIDKRLYEIARRHIGRDIEWKIGLKNLHNRTGSKASKKEFKRLIKESVESNHLPEFNIAHCTENSDVVIFTKRDILEQITGIEPLLSTDIYEKAKKIAPKYDVYYLKDEWLEYWRKTGCKTLKNPNGAFFAFCKKRHEQNPL